MKNNGKSNKSRSYAAKTVRSSPKQPVRRGTKKSPQAKSSAAPFITFAVALVLETCFIFSSNTGIVGKLLHQLFFGLFGGAAFTVPIIAALIAFFWNELSENGCFRFKVISGTLFALFFASLLHLFYFQTGGFSIPTFWENGISMQGGGVFGGTFAAFFAMVFGGVFSKIINVFLVLAAASFFIGATKSGIWNKVSEMRGAKKEREKTDVNEKSPSHEKLQQSFPAASSVVKNITPRVINSTASDPFAYGNEFIQNKPSPSVVPNIVNTAEDAPIGTRTAYNVFGYKNFDESEKEAGNTDNEVKIKVDEIIFDENKNLPLDKEPKKEYFNPFADELREKSENEEFEREESCAKSERKRRRLFGTVKVNDLTEKENFLQTSSIMEDEYEEKETSCNRPVLMTKGSPKTKNDKYKLPPITLLNVQEANNSISEDEIRVISERIMKKLQSFKVDARITGYSIGPSFTRYELTPGEGVKVKSITSLIEDISLGLENGDITISTITDKSAVGIEVPNKIASKVALRSLLEMRQFTDARSKITVCIGMTVTNQPVYMDIDDMPHVLIAGQTKAGKSVAINCMILSLLYKASPDDVKLILIDPKRVELNIYGKLPHLIMPVIDDPRKAAAALNWAVNEMEIRYGMMEEVNARNREEYLRIASFNPELEKFPQIVIIIDELADMMLIPSIKEHVELPINRLAAKARACGIHLIVGTQRPSVNIITGLIKANIPARISFKVASAIDSRIILDSVGAEKLLGRGDMIFHPTGLSKNRIQGAYVDILEIQRVLDFIIENNGKAVFDPEIMRALDNETEKLNKNSKKSAYGSSEDFDSAEYNDGDFENLCRAIEYAIENGKIATNNVQRTLKLGFNKAADIIDAMEKLGFVSPRNGSKPRDTLIGWELYDQWRNSQTG